MQWEDPAVVVMGLNFVWIVAFSVWQVFRGSNKRIYHRIDDHENRLTTVETKLDGAPNHRDVGDVYAKIGQVEDELSQLSSDVGKIAGTMKQIDKGVNLLMRHHITPGGDA